jgi:hypothetical protein
MLVSLAGPPMDVFAPGSNFGVLATFALGVAATFRNGRLAENSQ